MKPRKNRLRLLPLLGVAAGVTGIVSCASLGSPSGGARDEEPPVFVRANPAPGSVNVKRQKIDIDFNEIVNVKDAFTKVVISPVSKEVPRVSSLGRRVTVTFNDTLQDSTTYTIDFGNAIEDNNEGNKLQGFTYTFSTGPEIDTLQISGMVLSADGLEPQQGMLVGVYSNLADSAFSTLPLERIAKTDDRGRFSIKGLKPIEYRIFALADVDNDYKRANPEEAMAFYDFTIVPTSERVMATDSVWNLMTGELDTVINRERTRFLPNDILLRSFESNYKTQYLQNYERIDSTRLSLIFNAPADSLPVVRPVGFDDLEDWYVAESSRNNDTVTFWLKSHELLSLDSLRVAVTYLRPDSTRTLTPNTDTLRFFYPRDLKNAMAQQAKDREKEIKERQKKREKELKQREKEIEKKKEAGEPIEELVFEELTDSLPVEKPKPLALKVTSPSTQEVYLPLYLESPTPLERLDTSSFSLEVQVDTIWRPVGKPWKLERVDSGNPRQFKIEFPWAFETHYRLMADSLAAKDIYGLESDKIEYNFTTKSEDDYSAFIFDVVNFIDTVPAFMEIVNSTDVPVRREPVINGRAQFRFLAPGKYYARIFEDFNGNGVYDVGDYETGTQPDVVYYYPKLLNIKKNWERQETWNVFATAIDLMKPDNLKKNKPEADKRNKRKKENEEEDEEEEFDPTRNPFAD